MTESKSENIEIIFKCMLEKNAENDTITYTLVPKKVDVQSGADILATDIKYNNDIKTEIISVFTDPIQKNYLTPKVQNLFKRDRTGSIKYEGGSNNIAESKSDSMIPLKNEFLEFSVNDPLKGGSKKKTRRRKFRHKNKSFRKI